MKFCLFVTLHQMRICYEFQWEYYGIMGTWCHVLYVQVPDRNFSHPRRT